MEVLTPLEFFTLVCVMGYLMALMLRYGLNAWDVPAMLWEYTHKL